MQELRISRGSRRSFRGLIGVVRAGTAAGLLRRTARRLVRGWKARREQSCHEVELGSKDVLRIDFEARARVRAPCGLGRVLVRRRGRRRAGVAAAVAGHEVAFDLRGGLAAQPLAGRAACGASSPPPSVGTACVDV